MMTAMKKMMARCDDEGDGDSDDGDEEDDGTM